MAESASGVYLRDMHKTTLLVDDAKVLRARKILGTVGFKDTIDRALDEVLATYARRQALERLRHMKGLDLNRPKVLAAAWR
jgi:hypothetical protein